MSTIKRGLSGIYFRSQDPETGKWENIVFEDLSREEQEKYLEGRSEEWFKSMILQLATTLRQVGDEFNSFMSSNES